MTKNNNDEALEKWAHDPSTWAGPKEILRGEEAAAYGRSVLEAAGVDVEEVERSAGRPRIGGSQAPKGVRSPRVNVAISTSTETLLEEVRKRRGVTRSALVRTALDTYLHNAS